MDWKKDYKLSDLVRRGSSPEASAESAPESLAEQSVWKKEIRLSGLFRRKPADESPADSATDAEPDEPSEAIVAEDLSARPEAGVPEPAGLEAVPPAWPGSGEAAVAASEPAPGPSADDQPPGGAPFEGDRAEAPPADAGPAPEAPRPDGAEVGDGERAPVRQSPVDQPSEPEPEPEPASLVAGVESEPLVSISEAAEPREPSVWKKEVQLSGLFRRRRKAEAEASGTEAETTEGMDATGEPSAWKREIRLSGLFRRKSTPTAEPTEPRDEALQATAAAFAPPAVPVEPDDSTIAGADELEPGATGNGGSSGGGSGSGGGGGGRPVPPGGGSGRGSWRQPRAARGLPDVPVTRSINLLAREQRRARAPRLPLAKIGAAAAALIVAVAVAGFFYYQRLQIEEREGTVEDLEAQIAAAEKSGQLSASEGVQLAGESLSRAATVSSALEDRYVWDRLLRDLSLTLPEGVWFETIATSDPTVTVPDPVTGALVPSTAAQTLTLTGYALTQSDLAQFVGRLTVLPELSSVQLQAGQRVEIDEQRVIQFTIIASLKTDQGVVS